jgi:hypothetical protein
VQEKERLLKNVPDMLFCKFNDNLLQNINSFLFICGSTVVVKNDDYIVANETLYTLEYVIRLNCLCTNRSILESII